MNLRFLFAPVCILLWSLSVNAQKVCFEDFQEKVGKPLQKAIDQAKLNKDIDSLYQLSFNALKDLEVCQMPNFEVGTLTGKRISRTSLKGKVIVINFWFIGCAPCVAEIPALNKLVQHYKAKKVAFIAFGNSSHQPTVKQFLPKHKFDYQIITDSKAYAAQFNIDSWPTNMVFDQVGRLKYVSQGGFVNDRA